MKLLLSGEAVNLLLNSGYEPVNGARPLRRAVQRMLETPLSQKMLAGELKQGDAVSVHVDGSALTFQAVR